VRQAFVHDLRVRYGECDPQGIVFNANYLLYLDVAFTELWRECIGPWQQMVAHGVDVVVAEANLRFHAPARFDDELQLHARIARIGATAITTEIDVKRNEELLVVGHLRHVCVSTATWRKTDVPDWVHAGLARFAADAEHEEEDGTTEAINRAIADVPVDLAFTNAATEALAAEDAGRRRPRPTA
jgi:acyl-CoA thioester hydrolase